MELVLVLLVGLDLIVQFDIVHMIVQDMEIAPTTLAFVMICILD